MVSENHAKTFRDARNFIQAYSDRLQGVYIESRPAIEVIQRFDHPTALFYCDPPYPDTGQGHYGGFTQADFEDLIAVPKGCNGAVVLSCYDNIAVPEDWKKYEFSSVASSRGVTKKDRDHEFESKAMSDAGRVECVWIKPARGSLRPELQAAMDRYTGQAKQLNLDLEMES